MAMTSFNNSTSCFAAPRLEIKKVRKKYIYLVYHVPYYATVPREVSASAALPRKTKLEVRIHASLSLEYCETVSAIEMDIPEQRISEFVVIALQYMLKALVFRAPRKRYRYRSYNRHVYTK
jgi:hypothetical protein